MRANLPQETPHLQIAGYANGCISCNVIDITIHPVIISIRLLKAIGRLYSIGYMSKILVDYLYI